MGVFKTTEVYKKLLCDYTEEKLVWHKFFYIGTTIKSITETHVTPRPTWKEEFSAAVFYYLLPLLEKNPQTIYDLGCGANMFKRYLPNVIGIGEETPANVILNSMYNAVKDESWPSISSIEDFNNIPTRIQTECLTVHKLPINNIQSNFYGDIYGKFDDEYVAGHQNYFESVFAICSLHFHPLSDFKKTILDFASTICLNGRGFLSFNLQRLIDHTGEDFLIAQFGTITPTTMQYDNWVRKELSTTKLNFLILDVDLTLLDEAIDGNIRLVIEK